VNRIRIQIVRFKPRTNPSVAGHKFIPLSRTSNVLTSFFHSGQQCLLFETNICQIKIQILARLLIPLFSLRKLPFRFAQPHYRQSKSNFSKQKIFLNKKKFNQKCMMSIPGKTKLQFHKDSKHFKNNETEKKKPNLLQEFPSNTWYSMYFFYILYLQTVSQAYDKKCIYGYCCCLREFCLEGALFFLHVFFFLILRPNRQICYFSSSALPLVRANTVLIIFK
jgi:hypothetical protein